MIVSNEDLRAYVDLASSRTGGVTDAVGDAFTAEDARRMVEETQSQAVAR